MRIAAIVLMPCLLGGGTAHAARTLDLPELESRLPDGVRAMIDTAIAAGDPASVSTVVAIAKRTVPDATDEIDALVADYNHKLADAAAKEKRAEEANKQRERERLANAGFFGLWSGQLEAGGSWSTGNTRATGFFGTAKLKREGLNWVNEFSARVDFQETNGRTTTERLVGAFQPRYKFDAYRYAYGLAQYEHDRFLGYRHRFTGGVGVGVVAFDDPDLRVEFDVGPAFRFTSYYTQASEARLAARGGLNVKWLPWSTVTLRQEAALYLQQGATTASSTTSLETLLFGPVKARFSYNVQYESDSPRGQKDTDTVSRATIVYSF